MEFLLDSLNYLYTILALTLACISFSFFFFFCSTIYYMGHEGRPWQVQSTYLNRRKVKRNREKEKGGKCRKEGK